MSLHDPRNTSTHSSSAEHLSFPRRSPSLGALPETERLLNLLDRLGPASGDPAVLFVIGTPGSGKSTIIRGSTVTPGFSTLARHAHARTFQLDAHTNWLRERSAWTGDERRFHGAMVERGLDRLLRDHEHRQLVVWDGDALLEDVHRAADRLGLERYTFLFVDCSEGAREERLRTRGDLFRLRDPLARLVPAFTRELARDAGVTTLDTSATPRELMWQHVDDISRSALHLMRRND